MPCDNMPKPIMDMDCNTLSILVGWTDNQSFFMCVNATAAPAVAIHISMERMNFTHSLGLCWGEWQ